MRRDIQAKAVVGRMTEMAVVILYLAVVIPVLFGTVVPEFQDEAGSATAERVTAEVSGEIESITAENTTAIIDVDIPKTIQNEPYKIQVNQGKVHLIQHSEVGSITHPLTRPEHQINATGTWNSTEQTIIKIRTHGEEYRIQLLNCSEVKDGDR